MQHSKTGMLQPKWYFKKSSSVYYKVEPYGL
jgi:hypothetical protein